MLKTRRPAALTRESKRMNIVVADIPPVFETDSQFDGALNLGQEIRFVDLQQAMQRSERGYGRLTDPDSADGIGFHQHHIQIGSDQPGD